MSLPRHPVIAKLFRIVSLFKPDFDRAIIKKYDPNYRAYYKLCESGVKKRVNKIDV
jgi:hypothetical protein